MGKREAVLRTAAGEVGTVETPVNRTKYARWYGLDGNPWCAMFISWVFAMAGAPLPAIDSKKGFSLVANGYTYWKRRGELTTSPLPGDVVMYKFGSNPRVADHCGIFAGWIEPGRSFHAYEGNTSTSDQRNGGMVMRRRRTMTGVVAFARPSGLEGGGSGGGQSHPVLRIGASGTQVVELQRLLNERGATPQLAADGIFGARTQSEVRAFQRRAGIAVDGVVGPQTWRALSR